MNEILRKTHQKDNINLLKARDVFFDRARNLHKLYLISVVTPVAVAIVTYLPPLLLRYPFLEVRRDYIIGILTVLFLLIGYLIQLVIANQLEISNMLRELYDCNVFGIERNPYAYDFSQISNHNSKLSRAIRRAWESCPDRADGKYEVWYGEIFCPDSSRNILCFQMDNVIYTYHIYKDYMKKLHISIIVFLGFVISLLTISIILWKNLNTFFLIMFTFAGIVQMLIDMYGKTSELIEKNNSIFEYVKNNSDSIKEELAESNRMLRSLQDAIIRNRDQSLFVPKRVRDKYLKEGDDNPYYHQLNEIKEIYYKDCPAFIPEKAEEIDVLHSTGSDSVASLNEVHHRLLDMLIRVDEVMRENGIMYMLDGGTLIGASRRKGESQAVSEGGGFIFWDDDIDISVHISDVERMIDVLNRSLSDKYEIQHYENELFYSPRLSNLRIREKDDRSVLCEKDSELYEKYKYRGLFIDVYAYCPIIKNKMIDTLWRMIFIHPLYIRIRSVERRWKYGPEEKRVRMEQKFISLKRVYMKRVRSYVSMANNDEYYCYTPNYLENLKKPGPYLPKDILYSDIKHAQFEGRFFPVPSDATAVLSSFYGEKWYISPYKTRDELVEEKGEGKWYSSKIINVTKLKHYKYLDVFSRD